MYCVDGCVQFIPLEGVGGDPIRGGGGNEMREGVSACLCLLFGVGKQGGVYRGSRERLHLILLHRDTGACEIARVAQGVGLTARARTYRQG